MTQYRLSQLQRWILEQISCKGAISSRQVRGVYGKSFRDSLTGAERVTIHRTIRNLTYKGWIEKHTLGPYVLTEAGLLKVNEMVDSEKIVSFSAYVERRDEFLTGLENWRNAMRAFVSGFRRAK